MNIDYNAERAALRCRASDSSRTPGEQAAVEEAEKCEDKSRYFNRIGSTAEGAAFAKSAREWRILAVEARDEDLGKSPAGSESPCT